MTCVSPVVSLLAESAVPLDVPVLLISQGSPAAAVPHVDASAVAAMPLVVVAGVAVSAKGHLRRILILGLTNYEMDGVVASGTPSGPTKMVCFADQLG